MKPSFFQNEDLAQCGPMAMLLFEGLWCHADREGRLEYRPARIKVQILPYFDADVIELLSCLSKVGFIHIYEVEERKYIQVVNFTKHQNPHMKEIASTIPAPGKNGASTGNSGTSPADSLNPITLTLNPINTSARSRFVKPKIVDVQMYCRERNNSVDPSAFIDFYESNGWKVGRNPMKDWKAAIRTWEKKQRGSNGTHQQIDNSAVGKVRRANQERERRNAERQADGASLGKNGDDVRTPLVK